MFCRSCGKNLDEQAVVCVSCGITPKSGKNFCQHCGAATDPAAEICIKCGVRLATSVTGAYPEAKSRFTAGILGIFLGSLGIHRFYLGYTNGIAVAQLVMGLCGIITCGCTTFISFIWGLVDGIMILTGAISTDAHGKPLTD
jgi:TM2 domain-containing membrane protein YozV